MNIDPTHRGDDRQTIADEVFENLRSDIISLRFAPGEKLSEVEVSKQMGVSRQPVREAFIRLNNMNLLQVRPQRATVVRKISETGIRRTRFVRIAIEVEVVQRACVHFDQRSIGFKRNLNQQEQAAIRGDTPRFHVLDYEFHRLLCIAAGCEFAYETIAEHKAQVDRVCLLSLADSESMKLLHDDHCAIFEHLEARNSEGIIKLIRQHLSRLDQTLAAARRKYPDYFEK